MAGPASERDDSGTHKQPSKRVKEHEIRDALSRRLGVKTMTEVLTPAGSIDVLSENEVIEVKHYRSWKSGVGQVMAYGHYHPSHKKRLHLFAQKGDTRASKYLQLATPMCSANGIDVTFEEVWYTKYDGPEPGEKREVVTGSNDLGRDVVDGTNIFGISMVAVDSSTGDTQRRLKKKGSVHPEEAIVEKKLRLANTPAAHVALTSRAGMVVLLEAIKAAHARARVKAKASGDDAEKNASILQHMDATRFKDGHYGMVKYLQKRDEDFSPGEWYLESEFGKAPEKENKQKAFVALKDKLTKNDKFVWKWWFPVE